MTLNYILSCSNAAKKQLELVTAFTKDIGTTFRGDKYAYQQIQNIKLMRLTDTYRYLAINQNISYVRPINKDRITKEYYHRIKKTWNSKLSSFNKIIVHNTFAVPVFITSVVKAHCHKFMSSCCRKSIGRNKTKITGQFFVRLYSQTISSSFWTRLLETTNFNESFNIHAAAPSYKNLEKFHSSIFSKNWETSFWAYFRHVQKIQVNFKSLCYCRFM